MIAALVEKASRPSSSFHIERNRGHSNVRGVNSEIPGPMRSRAENAAQYSPESTPHIRRIHLNNHGAYSVMVVLRTHPGTSTFRTSPIRTTGTERRRCGRMRGHAVSVLRVLLRRVGRIDMEVDLEVKVVVLLEEAGESS